jgi:6-pyruvoyltetrahydropterin/6-carboxytetrahydropterin synthase
MPTMRAPGRTGRRGLADRSGARGYTSRMHELSKSFVFEAAHTLDRRIETESSRRIHGHSYRATIAIRGQPDPASGMLLDLGVLSAELARVHQLLDHRMLDDVEGLGPATLENLARYIHDQLANRVPGLARVTVGRDLTGDACSYSPD